MLEPNFQPIDILLVEDNPGDVTLIKKVFEKGKMLVNLTNVKDGVQAMDYLYKQKDFVNAVTPDIIILDLNLPKKDGREVLEEVKTDPGLKHIPVVVMTISQAEEDIFRSYHLQANCYVTKPMDYDQLIKVIYTLEDFWLAVVKLPPKT